MGQQNVLSSEVPEAASGISHSLSWRGFAWAAALPGLGIFLFYGLVLHSHLVLGRWPHFNEELPTWLLSVHDKCVWIIYAALFFSLYAVPVLLMGSLCFRKTRHFAVYFFAYAVFVALAGLSMQLAPHAFLNWFFD